MEYRQRKKVTGQASTSTPGANLLDCRVAVLLAIAIAQDVRKVSAGTREVSHAPSTIAASFTVKLRCFLRTGPATIACIRLIARHAA